MMIHCPVCGRGVHPGVFSLCSKCRAQISSLRPDDKRYFWYVNAVRRALFGSAE